MVSGVWALPLGAAAAVPFLPPAARRALAVAAPLAGLWLAVAADPVAGEPGADRLSRLFAIVFLAAAVLGGVFAWHLADRWQQAAALLYAGSAAGVATASTWTGLLVHWEVMLVGSATLVLAGGRRRSLAAGRRYLWWHVTSGSLLMAGVGWLLAEGVGAVGPLSAALPATGAVLVLLAALVNAGAPPLHAWLPDAYPEASPTGSVFLSAFTTKAAVYLLIRAFPGWGALVWVGVAMALYGVVYAVLENDVRRLLSYHIVSQVGYMVAAVGIGTRLALDGAAAHAFSHILYKALLFMGAGAVVHATGRNRLTRLGGLGRAMPVVAWLYMAGALSIAGAPLFNGFISKALVTSAADKAHLEWAAVALALASVGTFLSIGLKLPWFAFLSEPKGPAPARRVPGGMVLAMWLAAGSCLLFGLFPGLLYGLLPGGAMVDGSVYRPWTLGHALESVQLLSLTAAAFFLLLPRLAVEPKVSLDTDRPLRRLAEPLYGLLVRVPGALEDALGGVRDRAWQGAQRWFADPSAPARGGGSPGPAEAPDSWRQPWRSLLFALLATASVILVLAL